MSRIVIEKNKVIIDGHAKDVETCNTLTNLCDELSKSEKFSTVKYENGYGEFESVEEAEEKKFATKASLFIYSNDGSELLLKSSLVYGENVYITNTGVDFATETVYTYGGSKTFLGFATEPNSTSAVYSPGNYVVLNGDLSLYVVESASLTLTDLFTDIADSIRAKANTTDTIKALDFPEKIAAIPTTTISLDDVEESDVNFYDYDGTLLYAWTLAETAAKTELPPLPSHDGLICQGWNWTLDEIKALGRECVVGANYITDDGKTRLYIKVTDELALLITLVFTITQAGSVTVDWGDGSAAEVESTTGRKTKTHQYALGDYMITLDPSDGTVWYPGANDVNIGILGSIANANRPNIIVLRKAEFGRNIGANGISIGCFRNCNALDTVSAPQGAAISRSSFEYANSLKAFIIPRGGTVEGRGTNATFSMCLSLLTLSLPPDITVLGAYFVNECGALKAITIPNGVTYIGNQALYKNRSLQKLVIPDSVATLGNYMGELNYATSVLTLGTGVTVIPTQCFGSIYGLTRVTVNGDVTSIAATAFFNCYSIKLYDFTHCTAVPTLANTNAFAGIHADCQIKVPASLADEWKAATNWATYADNIVGVEA